MKKSKLLQKAINKLVEASFKDGKILENQVVKSIKALKSLPKYEAIQALSEYLKGLKRRKRQHTLYIETSVPPSSIQLKKINKFVSNEINKFVSNEINRIVEKRVKITKTLTYINPEILGGFKLKIGDEIWDGSILGKLNQVKEAIIHV